MGTIFIKKKLSFFKVLFYKLLGYKIGSHVYIGRGVKIKGKRVVIGDGCYLLDNTDICANEIRLDENVCIFENVRIKVKDSLHIGMHSKISRNCLFKAYSIDIGRDFWCNENVEVGGGGCFSNRAKLFVGDYMHVGRDVHLNVCREIILDGYSGIGMGCMLFTHSAGQGQSILRGYSFTEAPIHIEKNVSLYSRVIVSPGTTVRQGAIVASQAFIRGTLEKETLYAGIPAVKKRVIKNIRQPLNILKDYFFVQDDTISLPSKCLAYIVLNRQSIELHNGDIIITDEQNCDKFNTEQCVIINLDREEISGQANADSEWLRDSFRRHGIILKPVDNYEFFPLDPFKLKLMCVEK